METIDWSDPRCAIPSLVTILDALKEQVSLNATGRELEISSLVGELDDLLMGVEERVETRGDEYFFGVGAFYDFENMISFWKELITYGVTFPVSIPESPY